MIIFFKNNSKKLTILTGLVILISFILLSPSIVSAVTCYYDPDTCGSSYPYSTNICGGTWCWSSCPQGDCCCMYWWNGEYYEYKPWCCYTAGSIPPTNCNCGEANYCCWPDAPVLCENSCWPAGTQCSSCNGQIVLSPPTLISPSNGATDVSTTPTLDWSDVVGADGWYHLYYKKSSETSWSVKSNLSYSRYIFTSDLDSYTTYQWQVRACNPGPVCEDSVTWSFTTGALIETNITCSDCDPPKYLNDVVHFTVSATNESIGISQLCLGIKKEGQAQENLCYEGCGGAVSCSHTWPVTLDFSGTDPDRPDWTFYGIAQYTDGGWGGWVGGILIDEVIAAACSDLSFPTTKWQRVWYDYDWNCLGDGPDETVEQFDNNWGSGTIAYGKSDNIIFKSSRSIYFADAGIYRFTLVHDDGVKLYIDDNLEIDEWQAGSDTHRVDVNLTAGWHDFQIDWFEATVSAGVEFSYEPSTGCPAYCVSQGYDYGLCYGPLCRSYDQCGDQCVDGMAYDWWDSGGQNGCWWPKKCWCRNIYSNVECNRNYIASGISTVQSYGCGNDEDPTTGCCINFSLFEEGGQGSTKGACGYGEPSNPTKVFAECKLNSCSSATGHNGENCTVFRNCNNEWQNSPINFVEKDGNYYDWSLATEYVGGKWDASNKQCVKCSGNKKTHKYGDTTTLSYVTCFETILSSGDIPDICESACGASPECDEKNPGDLCGTGKTCDSNCQCIFSAQPDLVIDDIFPELPEGQCGDTITYTIRNQGGEDAGSSYTKLYVDGVYKEYDSEGTLAAGSSRSTSNQSFSYDWKANYTAPSDTIKVCADDYDYVEESNEANNCREEVCELDNIPPEAEIIEPPAGERTGPGALWYGKNQEDLNAVFKYSDNGGAGLLSCLYKVETRSYGGSWVTTLPWVSVGSCSGSGPLEFAKTITVGSSTSNLCYNQGADTCRISVMAYDNANPSNESLLDYKTYHIDWESPSTE